MTYKDAEGNLALCPVCVFPIKQSGPAYFGPIAFAGAGMARIVAAYIAHGLRYQGPSSAMARFKPSGLLLQDWKRVFCNFALIRELEDDQDAPRLLLFTDHVPPVIDGRLLEFYLRKLNVEIYVLSHLWRPEIAENSAEFFAFDAIEQLAKLSTPDDQILLFGPRASIVHALNPLYDNLLLHDVIFAEAQTGDLDESHVRALHERMAELRAAYDIAFPADAVNAISSDFIGFTHNQLNKLMVGLRQLFPQTLASHHNGYDGFRTVGEILAALLAQDNIFRPPHSHLSGLAAAMPEDFAVAKLTDVPVVLPGYGREPDIEALYSVLLPDRVGEFSMRRQARLSEIFESKLDGVSAFVRIRKYLNIQRVVPA